MKKLLTALAFAITLALASCGPTAPATATPMPECATGEGDTDAAAEKFLHEKWPNDNLYFFTDGDMDLALYAAMFVQGVTTLPPVDASELWISSGPGGDGTTVFVLFAQDCYLGAFNLTQAQFDQAMGLAFPDGVPAPLHKGSLKPTSHNPERSA